MLASSLCSDTLYWKMDDRLSKTERGTPSTLNQSTPLVSAVPLSPPMQSLSTPTSFPANISMSTPTITITASPQQRVAELEAQLTTALAALELARQTGRSHAEKVIELEQELARAASDGQVQLERLEVELALERAKVKGLEDERDLAKERLERVKTMIFSVT